MNSQDFLNAQKIWNIPSSTMTHIDSTSHNYRLKHGMFATVPIICQADKCPYFAVCSADPKDRIKGFRCPMEIAAIIERYDMWCEHFNLNTTSETIPKDEVTDASLVRDLVDNEIQTMRAENKIAISGDFIGKTLADIDNKGKAYWEDTVSPEAQFKMDLQDKRYKILQLLNSTRKDKAAELLKKESFSNKALSLIEKVKQQMPNIDLDNISENTSNEVKKENEPDNSIKKEE